MQWLLGRAEKGIGMWIIVKIFSPELVSAQYLWLAVVVGILVEGIVFQEVS